MHWTDRRKRFRAVLSGERCVHPGSVFDPISARIAEDLGFEIGMFAGSTASLTVLGAPDLIVLTLSEFAGQAYRINRAGGLPLLVDADHGYGNALNVKRTVEELETAGVAGLSIEDTDLPTPFGTAKPRLTTLEEGVGKMKAALAGRQDPLLCIAGRTSAIQMRCSSSASELAPSSTRYRLRPRCRSSWVAPPPSSPTATILRAAACASHCRATSRSPLP
jgi:oxaloacetate decarboxylase